MKNDQKKKLILKKKIVAKLTDRNIRNVKGGGGGPGELETSTKCAMTVGSCDTEL